MDDKDKQIAELTANITALTASVNMLMQQSQDTAPRIIRKGVTERKLRLRFVDGNPVIGYENRGTEKSPRFVYEAPDPQNPKESKLYVNLIVKDVKDPIRVSYNEFLNEGESIECKIIKQEQQEKTEEHGMVRRKEVDGYSMLETDVLVPMEVTSVSRTYTVELPSGEQISVAEDSGVINI